MSELLVDAAGIGRCYLQGAARITALAPATFQIRQNARIAIMGRSGSGKSTLLHLIAGLDTPTCGSLSWPMLGAREQLLPRSIAIAFQAPSLLPSLTVAENVALPLLLGAPAPDVDARVAATLAVLDLSELSDKLPEQLSGGQIQRVALARAMAIRPSLILADEPTGQLDLASGVHALDSLLADLKGSATALVVSTHDPAIAERMDTVWLIDHGVLVAGTAGQQP
jgi:ABC-type lipoprotein export system ATPase subunit